MDQEEASGSTAQTSSDSSVEGTNLAEKLQLEAERRKRKLEYCRQWKKKQKVQKIEQGLVKTPLTESERTQRKRENQKRYRERQKESKMKSNEQEGLVRTPLTESERLQRKRKNDKRYRERKKEAKMMSNEQEECEEKQLTFDSFTLGKFTSFVHDGCPDGDMQIWEWDRPRIGGSWCGSSWGPTLYYSETRSVTVSLRLMHLSRDQSGYNFDFTLAYKMLPKNTAVVRYGGLNYTASTTTQTDNGSTKVTTTTSTASTGSQHYLGELIEGTFCSRVFTDCNKKDCRLQSPNFPGIYPRNLTCYYAVRQQEIPAGKHALIAVKQPKGQLINIRSQTALYPRPQQQQQQSQLQQPNQNRQLKVWKECDEVQDYVTVYDGYTTRDPVLLKFCGGGTSVPEAISSGHELLVEFSTSPYGTFLYPTPPLPLHGFQLQVQVKFVDKDTPKYARNKRCEFWLRGAGKGILESPRHSLSANTTCLYHLQGADPNSTPPPRHLELSRRRTHSALFPTRYRVWLAVLKFHSSSVAEGEDCSAMLQIWDGNIKAAPACNDIFCDKEASHGALIYNGGKANLTLLARYCKDHIPRSCDHSLLANSTRLPRPCSLAESFLSSGDALTLELKLTESTALRPVSFRALYEFVDLHQDGEPYGKGPCSRRFVSRAQTQPGEIQTFTSPQDVFLYGRGGSTNLSCVYRFEAQKGESVRITITTLKTGNRSDCTTKMNNDTGRLQCLGKGSVLLRMWEAHWGGTSAILPRDCLCSQSEYLLPFTFTSTAHIVEVHFQVIHMTPSDDFRGLNFQAKWEFIRSPICTRNQKLYGPSGEINFRSPSRTPDEVNCEGQPWLIEPRESRYLYVKLLGVLIKGTQSLEPNATVSATNKCTTRNRVVIHAGNSAHVVVCPMPHQSQRHHVVEVFSEGWVIGGTTEQMPPMWSNADSSQSRSIIVEFIPRESGFYTVTWLELARRPSLPPPGLLLSDCPHRCPELDACINGSLWCDGINHCPSGFDEAARHCFYLLQLPPLYLAIGAFGFFIVICTFFFVSCRICRKKSKSSTRLKSLPSDTEAIVGTPKEVIC